MEVSYKEVEDALIQLGFKDMSTTKQFYFVEDKHKAIFKMPLKNASEIVLKAHFAANSYGLWATGVIKDIHTFFNSTKLPAIIYPGDRIILKKIKCRFISSL